MALWDKIQSRGNVEDRRSFGPTAVGGLSVTGVVLLLLFNVLTGGDVADSIDILGSISVPAQEHIDASAFQGEDTYEVFTSTVLGSTNDMWESLFSRMNKTYIPPTLVLFRESTQSACGGATSQVGPHYCPLDKTIYLDETFFDELKLRFQAKGGDVAEAYVLAHEVGHHVQQELGIMDTINQKIQENDNLTNDLSIKLELQADCFAGLWANSIKDAGIFLDDEIQEALDAASAVGDDRIQQTINGRINPESWTHGSSAARVQWFSAGFETGLLDSCNTFTQ